MDEIRLPHRHGEGRDTPRLQEQLDRVDHFQTVADVFKQLDDTTRLRAFWLLCHCEQCVVNLSAMLNMSSPAVSHHLRALKSSGLIVSRRVGKEVYYRAADTQRSRLLHQMMERIMEITCPEQCGEAGGQGPHPARPDPDPSAPAADCPPEQSEIVREIHGQLLRHMDRRITIEALSRQYHINPTTLKAAFKAVYGASLAAHIKEHRMERAARLLRETDLSVAEIARAVGYDSQSRFSAAFKGVFGVLPREYRRPGGGA